MGGIGSGNSKSSQTSAQTTVSTAGSTSPASAGAGSPVNTGNQIVISGNNSRYDATPTVVADALNTVSNVVNEALGSIRQTVQGVSDNNEANQNAQAAILSQVLGSAQETAANTASGGQTEQNKTILYIVGAALAVVGAVLIFRRN